MARAGKLPVAANATPAKTAASVPEKSKSRTVRLIRVRLISMSVPDQVICAFENPAQARSVQELQAACLFFSARHFLQWLASHRRHPYIRPMAHNNGMMPRVKGARGNGKGPRGLSDNASKFRAAADAVRAFNECDSV
jgi:hypothetical protein